MYKASTEQDIINFVLDKMINYDSYNKRNKYKYLWYITKYDALDPQLKNISVQGYMDYMISHNITRLKLDQSYNVKKIN